MKDICFTQLKTQTISPVITGKTSSSGQIVYQKLLMLLLSNSRGLYRSGAGTSLVRLLQGINIPQLSLLKTLGATACNEAYSLLQPQDAQLIQSLQVSVQGGQLSIILKLKDGQTYTGVLAG